MRSSWHIIIHSVCWWIFSTINYHNWRKFVNKNHVTYCKHRILLPELDALWYSVVSIENACVLRAAYTDSSGQWLDEARILQEDTLASPIQVSNQHMMDPWLGPPSLLLFATNTWISPRSPRKFAPFELQRELIKAISVYGTLSPGSLKRSNIHWSHHLPLQ